MKMHEKGFLLTSACLSLISVLSLAGCGGSGGDLFVQKEDNTDLIQCITKVVDSTAGYCLTTMDWMPKSQEICAAENRVPKGDPIFSGECGQDPFNNKKYSGMVFQCCLPPSPDGCTSEYQGNSQTCKNEQDWQQLASTACQAQSKVLGTVTYLTQCQPGPGPGVGGPPPGKAYSLIKYDCCTPATVE
jgi:hypothetical protein